MNHHAFLGMFLAVRGHPYSRFYRRMTFLAVNCLLFFLSIIVHNPSLSNQEALSISIFIFSPGSFLVKKWFYYLLACPCINHCRERNTKWSFRCVKCWSGFGHFLSYPLIAGFLSLLFVAGLFTVFHPSKELFHFIYAINLVAFGEELLYILCLFGNGRFYWKLQLLGIPIITIGKYFHDKAILLQWKYQFHHNQQLRDDSTSSTSSNIVADFEIIDMSHWSKSTCYLIYIGYWNALYPIVYDTTYINNNNNNDSNPIPIISPINNNNNSGSAADDAADDNGGLEGIQLQSIDSSSATAIIQKTHHEFSNSIV
jgi:hypothetical protein